LSEVFVTNTDGDRSRRPGVPRTGPGGRRELAPDALTALDESPQQLVRRTNERRVFHLIRQSGPTSRVALVHRLSLSAQSVGAIIRRLLDQGLVEETGSEPQRGVGRNPMGVAIRARGALAFGCNVERDRIDGAWIDLSGAVVTAETVHYPQGEEPQLTIRRIEQLFQRLSSRPELGDDAGVRLAAVGLGLPGPIDRDKERLVNPPNFPHWEGVDPRAHFSDDWALPVYCENSATAAALGEAWQARNELTNFLYCHWGIGIGGGLVIDLQTFQGASGNAVELGHVPVVSEDGALCGCGARGCLEAEASVAALVRQAAAFGVQADPDELLLRAADDPRIGALLERAGRLLAQALLGAANLFDVDAVVLGGGHLLQAERWLVAPVETALRENAIRRGIRPIVVRRSDMGELAGAVGAASVVFDKLLPSDVNLIADGPSYRQQQRS
jgi:predicted NBD/HSP70 family sugar kinase